MGEAPTQLDGVVTTVRKVPQVGEVMVAGRDGSWMPPHPPV